jgi:hypothetical protein
MELASGQLRGVNDDEEAADAQANSTGLFSFFKGCVLVPSGGQEDAGEDSSPERPGNTPLPYVALPLIPFLGLLATQR